MKSAPNMSPEQVTMLIYILPLKENPFSIFLLSAKVIFGNFSNITGKQNELNIIDGISIRNLLSLNISSNQRKLSVKVLAFVFSVKNIEFRPVFDIPYD